MQTMENFDQMGLVLEGGGMRGVFTCGVLDYLLDAGIEFPYVVGVSAGACNGLSYISRQRGRARSTNIDIMDQYHYIGLKYWFRQHSVLDMHLLFDVLPKRLLPYDYETYKDNPTHFEMVTTDCITGKPCYMHDPGNEDRILRIVKASSSLPYVCPVQFVDHRPMLDGGIVDSIPLARAISKGYERNVVVLTRNRGYRKADRNVRLPRFVYNRFPNLRVALSNRNHLYNEQLDYVERMEDEGRILVIRPQRPIEVGRMERDVNKLRALYEEGYACARECFEKKGI